MLGFVFSVALLHGQPPPAHDDGIIFLHLRATPTGFELIDAKTVKGTLRIRRYNPEQSGLHIELRSVDNQVLFQNVYPDPIVTRLEYEDPSVPGKIVAKPITPPSSEFTIRIPYFANAKVARFYRPIPTKGGVTGRGTRPALIYLGEVPVPANERPQ